MLEDGTENLVYTFRRLGGDISSPLTVNYKIGGKAVNGNDYSPIGTSVTFAAGSATATVIVNPTADTPVEGDETVVLNLDKGTGYSIGTKDAVKGIIASDEFLPSITLAVSASAPTAAGAPRGSVLEDSKEKLVYTFTRTGDLSSSLEVNFRVGGTAIGNDDTGRYSVTFAAGSATAIFTVDPLKDQADEDDETVVLTLDKGKGYSIGTKGDVTGTIIDDDVLRPGTKRYKAEDYSLSGSSLTPRKDKAKLPPTENTDATSPSSGFTASALNALAAAATSNSNTIVTENQKAGVANTIWDAPISNQIEGFATDFSVDNGSTVNFKINVSTAACSLHGSRSTASVTTAVPAPPLSPRSTT